MRNTYATQLPIILEVVLVVETMKESQPELEVKCHPNIFKKDLCQRAGPSMFNMSIIPH